MLEIVVELLHFVVLRKKPFDSCAAGYHGDGIKEKRESIAFSMTTLLVYASCSLDVEVMYSCVEPRNSVSPADCCIKTVNIRCGSDVFVC
jgi:hypothetical protein